MNLAHAGLETPEGTVTAFYEHIKHWECDDAASLAKGYASDNCLDIKQLNVMSLETVQQSPAKALVRVHVVYSHIDSSHIDQSCKGTLPLNRKAESWVIDFSAKQFKCTSSTHQATAAANPQTPPVRIVLTPPAQNNPAPRPPPIRPAETLPARSAFGGTLLDTWRFEELQGQAGDERIIKLHPPDHTPPQRTQPSQRLGPLDARRYDSIRRVRLPEGKNLVALTFDLCEQADDRTGYDRAIVNTLRERQTAATFFAGGKWLRSHEDKALQLMADPHFEIGNHAWTHGNLRVLKGQKMLDQIIWTQAEYERIWEILNRRAIAKGLQRAMDSIPRQPLTLRFPYGTCSAESLRTTNELGLSAIQWDVVSGDAAAGVNADELARNIVSGVRAGSIIVFHANGRGHGTAAALPRIIDALTAKGYTFTTVSQLLQQGIPETAQECFELKPGDNKRYDALFGEGTE